MSRDHPFRTSLGGPWSAPACGSAAPGRWALSTPGSPETGLIGFLASGPGLRILPAPGGHPESVWLLRASHLAQAKMHRAASSQGLDSGPRVQLSWTPGPHQCELSFHWPRGLSLSECTTQEGSTAIRLSPRHPLFDLWDPLNRHEEDKGKWGALPSPTRGTPSPSGPRPAHRGPRRAASPQLPLP